MSPIGGIIFGCLGIIFVVYRLKNLKNTQVLYGEKPLLYVLAFGILLYMAVKILDIIML